MRVTRLEIFGFKSFRERFVLNFDKDLIGIIGPNGCGKSNIVDALRWVLGETHAKQLRGNVFDDLIFNGSDSHRPLGMAEVSVTIRPDEHWKKRSSEFVADLKGGTTGVELETEDLVSEEEKKAEKIKSNGHSVSDIVSGSVLAEIPGLLNAAEIQLTRRLYRSGESEYFINRVPCRLRDMTDLYRLIGLGARGLSIVQQGQIGEIISKKPIDRRELLEEAAGISGFRTRIEAAQRKLERTAENMARLSDIITEVDKQVKVLKRQAARAKNRNELKAGLKTIENDLFRAKLSKIVIVRTDKAAQNEKLKSELANKRSRFDVLDALQSECRAELETCDNELSELRENRDRLSDELHGERLKENEFRVQLAKLDMQLKNSEERQTQLTSQIELLSEKAEEHRRHLAAAEEGLVESLKLKDQAERELNPEGTQSENQGLEDRERELVIQYERLLTLTVEIRDRFADLRKVRAKLHQHRDVYLGDEKKALLIEKEIELLNEFLVITRDKQLSQESAQLESRRAAKAVEFTPLAARVKELAAGVVNYENELRDGEFELLKKEALRDELIQAQAALVSVLQETFDKSKNAEKQALLGKGMLIGKLQNITSRVASLESSVQFETRALGEVTFELERCDNELVMLKNAYEDVRLKKQGLERNLSTSAVNIDEGKQLRIREMEREFDILESHIRELEKKRGSIRERVAESAEEFEMKRREIISLSEKESEVKLALEKCDIEQGMIIDEFRRITGEDLAVPADSEVQEVLQKAQSGLEIHIKELEEEANRLRRRLEREGEVDSETIELYETESKRLLEMQKQFDDLESAAKILERTIRQLKEISRTRFMTTFKAVSEQFAVLVPRLFGGGAGRLSLIDPEDPLTSGVDLAVRPPGKHLRSMELLSGGEKALVAIALLMAMFLHRPSPLCVLDEVDAPLDDTNLERYVNLIRDNSDKAQFLIITHNKLTMAAVDRLVGITMQEKGVSTALSVTLEEAEQQLETLAANA